MKAEQLARAYAATSSAETRAVYDEVAGAYDADTIAKGFRPPNLAAAFLARHLDPAAGPVLDAACGTGQVGELLGLLGYGPIVGCDLSSAMLEVAAQRKLYDALTQEELGTPLSHASDAFAGFVCIGAFGPGHAPPRSLRELARVTMSGGVGVFNLREDSLVAQGFAAELDAMEREGVVRVRQHSAPFRVFILAEPELLTRIVVVEVL